LLAIEFKRFQSNSYTKRLIECRRCLEPPPVDVEIGVRVPEKTSVLARSRSRRDVR
jgi:hypothetical protein